MSEPTKQVAVYVRLVPGDENGHDGRVLSFKVPAGIDPIELLDHGFALDGNQAAATVGPTFHINQEPGYVGPFDIFGASLTDALARTQRELVEYFRERGFEPRFS
jgi:hypothetical protein